MAPGSPDALESLVGRVADEFTRPPPPGELPRVEEYADRYPGLAGLLREVRPAVLALGSARGSGETPGGAVGDVAFSPGPDQIISCGAGAGGPPGARSGRDRLGRPHHPGLARPPGRVRRGSADPAGTHGAGAVRRRHPRRLVRLQAVRCADGGGFGIRATTVPPAAKGALDVRPTKLVVALAFTPDDRRLACADQNGVDLIDPDTSRVSRVIAEFGVWDLAVSPDGRYLATATRHPDVPPGATSCANSKSS